MKIEDVHQDIQGNKKRNRIGRGPGSGHGKTASRGHKGQRSRAGWSQPAVFQGGAMPLVRRVPKRGFNNSKFATKVAVINVGELEQLFGSGDEVTPQTLRQHAVLKQRYDELKVLGNGELTKKLKISAHRFSQTAVAQIEKAGGEVVLLPKKVSVAEKKAGK